MPSRYEKNQRLQDPRSSNTHLTCNPRQRSAASPGRGKRCDVKTAKKGMDTLTPNFPCLPTSIATAQALTRHTRTNHPFMSIFLTDHPPFFKHSTSFSCRRFDVSQYRCPIIGNLGSGASGMVDLEDDLNAASAGHDNPPHRTPRVLQNREHAPNQNPIHLPTVTARSLWQRERLARQMPYACRRVRLKGNSTAPLGRPGLGREPLPLVSRP